MYEILKAFVALVVTALVVDQLRTWYAWRSLRKWGEQHGCGEAPTVKNKLPGGLERYAIFFKNMKDLDFLEDVVRARALEMGPTYRFHGLFNRSSRVSTSSPANVQAMLAMQFHDFDLGPARKRNFSEMLGNGIFTAEGEAWAHYRRQLKPQFTRDQVSDLASAAGHLEILFRALPAEEEAGEDGDAGGWIKEVDLMPLMYRFTMDVATEFLFGSSVNSQTTAMHSSSLSSLEPGSEGITSGARAAADEGFAEAMDYCQGFVAYRMRLGVLDRLVPSRRFREACKTIREFASGFVTLALERNPVGEKNQTKQLDENENEKAKAKGKGKFILLDALLEETRDPIELRDQVLQTLLAGRDTTASLISWALLLLSRDPTRYASARSTVLAHFGTPASPTGEELTSFSSLKSCKVLTHIVYETLRLYPLVPLNSRTAVRDTVLPTGGGPDGDRPVAIMKGEQVAYSAYVMHRRKDIWGEDAEVWRPERWEGRKLGWEWISFSGGPRVCLGQQYALNEATFVLATFLQRFDKIEALDMGPIKKGLTIALSPGSGVKVQMHRAPE